jgi:hypothetical protein
MLASVRNHHIVFTYGTQASGFGTVWSDVTHLLCSLGVFRHEFETPFVDSLRLTEVWVEVESGVEVDNG